METSFEWYTTRISIKTFIIFNILNNITNLRVTQKCLERLKIDGDK